MSIDQIKKDIRANIVSGHLLDLCDSHDALENEVAELHTKDSVRTKEHNILTQESRALAKEVSELKAQNQDDHETLQLLRTVLKDVWQEGDDGEADVVVRILNRRDQLKRWHDEVYDYGRNPADKETAWFLKAKEIQAERDRLKGELDEQGRTACSLFDELKKSQAEVARLKGELREVKDLIHSEDGYIASQDALRAEVARLQKERDEARERIAELTYHERLITQKDQP